jgi:hypothetical protein
MAKTSTFSWSFFFLRFLLAVIVVFGTYNPSGMSYTHWALSDIHTFSVVKALVGLMLVGGWGVLIHAAYHSLGVIGLIMVSVFFGLLFWLILDTGKKWLPVGGVVVQYALLLIVAFVLVIGVLWSHLHRKLTGQVDISD